MKADFRPQMPLIRRGLKRIVPARKTQNRQDDAVLRDLYRLFRQDDAILRNL